MRDTLPKPNYTQPTTDPSCEESIPDTLRMITPEDAARAALRDVVGDLGHDEVRVLTRIAERLRAGQRQYGLLCIPKVLATEPTDEACRVRAHELARAVGGCLHTIQPRHASVLRAAYTPRRWPRAVENAFDVLAPIAVRLAFAQDPWPARSGHTGLEEAAALRLSAALRDPGKLKVATMKARAHALLGDAVAAYAAARSEEGGALGLA